MSSRNVGRSVRILLIALALSFIAALPVGATAMFGSEAPDIFLIKIMLRSEDDRSCVARFLINKRMSSEGKCKNANKSIQYIFYVKKLDIDDENEIAALEYEVIEYILRQYSRNGATNDIPASASKPGTRR